MVADEGYEQTSSALIATKLCRLFDRVHSLSQEQILEAVLTEKIFGCVLCDIEVPDSLKDYFSEMCPIFKNVDICFEDIGDLMKGDQTKLDRKHESRENSSGHTIIEVVLGTWSQGFSCV